MEKNRVILEEKKSPVAGDINYVWYLSMQKVKDSHTLWGR